MNSNYLLCAIIFVVYATPVVAFSIRSPYQSQGARFCNSRRSDTLLHSSVPASSEFEFPEDAPNQRSDSSKSSKMGSSEESRKLRFQVDERAKSRFLSGDALHQLRQRVLDMRIELEEARRTAAEKRVKELQRAMIIAQQVDAEFVYGVAVEKMAAATAAGLEQEARKWEKEAMEARSALPQFNLEGLWVGRYGDHGYEMINVTYTGNTLVAYKVTGDKNVPAGEITFTADLSVGVYHGLEPIELADKAAEQWGSKYLQRFPGVGQVAAEGYVNSQWMDGQLILVNEYFSFAWLPIGHQVFFGRPSAELTLKLLRQSKSGNQEDKLRDHLAKCMEETEILEDEMEVSDGLFTSHNQQDYYSHDGCFE